MAGVTKKDIFDTLTEFYGKVIEPEFKAIRTKLEEHDQKFRDILQHFDEIYKRLEGLRLNTMRSTLLWTELKNDLIRNDSKEKWRTSSNAYPLFKKGSKI